MDTYLWIVSGLFVVLLVAAFYALSTGDEFVFRIIASLLIGVTGAAVWIAFFARRQGWG